MLFSILVRRSPDVISRRKWPIEYIFPVEEMIAV